MTQNTNGNEPCPRGADRPEPTCTNRHQCWEPCGELGKDERHVRVSRTDPGKAKTFAKESWQHAVDDALIEFGKTSEEFDTPHEAVAWLLGVQSEYAVDCFRRATAGAQSVAPPQEPTPEMIEAGFHAANHGIAQRTVRAVYHAMVKAAAFGVKAPAPGHGIAELCALKNREAIAANLLRFGGLNKHHACRVAAALLDTAGVDQPDGEKR